MAVDIIDKKQKLLVEYLLSDRSTFIRCIRIIKPAYFEAPLDRVVEFVLEYFDKHHNVPTVDMIEADVGVELKERVLNADEEGYFLDEFEQHCKQSAMEGAILGSVDLIQEGNFHQVSELVRDALMVRLDNSLGTVLFDDPLSRIECMHENVEERSCGIDAIDGLTNKIRRGELGIFFGGTGTGKSVMLANLARNMSIAGLNGLVISLEMGEDLYAKRLDSIVTGIKIAEHTALGAQIAEILTDMKATHGSILIKRLPFRSTNTDIRAVVMEYHLKYGVYPDALYVDYLALMGIGGSSRNMNKFDEDEIKAFGLREICQEFGMYGFTGGQINRDAYDVKSLGPQHVAGGISVINASDWSVGLVASDEDIENNQIQAIQMKVRNGSKTVSPVTLYRCPHTLRLTDKPTMGKFTPPVTPSSQKPKTTTKTTAKSSTKNDPPAPTADMNGKDKLRALLKKRG